MVEPVNLPRRYRPLGARVAAGVAAVVLAAVVAFLWMMLPSGVRDEFSGFQRITLIAVFAAMLALLYGIFRTSALADQHGLTITNGYHVRRLDWPQIVRVSMSPHRPWALLDLADGTTVSVMAIQASDGARAARSARELAAVLIEHTRTDRDD